MGSREKVHKAASKLLSGRIGIICDGSPYVLTAPYYFIEAFQSAEDYLKNPWYSSFLRFVRFFAFTLNIYFPAVFIALIYHHSQTFPKKLLEFIHSLEENSAISMFWEMLLMLVLFELIREVGVRMPRTVGDAAGLVGSLILGDAAVEAGISSITIIVIVAISSVSAYITPSFASPAVILRFLMLFAGYFSGLYGIIAITIVWGVFMLKKKSFGNSYMYPLYPFDPIGMLDYIVVVPKKVLGRKEGEKR
jgi:spore germination protein KA